jgi:hypothetical protein
MFEAVLIEKKIFGTITQTKENVILPPSLNPSHQGREVGLLPLEGGIEGGDKMAFAFI